MRKFLLGFLVGALAFPAVILLAAALGLFPIRANTSPSHWESALAHMAIGASARRRAPRVPNPIEPTEEHLMAGVKLFKDDCAGCHGTPETAPKNEVDVTLFPTPLNLPCTLPTNQIINCSGSSGAECATRGCSRGAVSLHRTLGKRCI